MHTRLLARFILAGALGLGTTGAFAAFVASTDRFSYAGTMDGVAIPGFTDGNVYTGRDGSMLMASGASGVMPSGLENVNNLGTAWYYTIDPNNGSYSGWANPNNVERGFLQLSDDTGGSRTSVTGGWADGTYKHFQLVETGANAYDPPYSRLGLPGCGQCVGTFTDYSLVFDAFFTNAATLEFPGWYSTLDDPASVSGTFSGHFVLDGDPTVHAFSLTFGSQSWAFDNAELLNGDFIGSYFGADEVRANVPEPASLALLGAGAVGLAWRRRRLARVSA